ncbi:MAG: winged helix-turn-helix domain-containing protein [Pyrinomonadaceae bacterium]
MVKRNALAKKDEGKSRADASVKESLRGVRASRAVETAPADLDRVIHERVRLAMISALAVNKSLTFNDLKGLLNITDGNLSVHARKLEEAEYVTCNKFFDGRTPKTEYTLTAAGRRALERYLDHMEALIRATRGS